MDKLREAYTSIKKILGDNTEPLDSVELVEAYRRYFKPEKVRVLLLAESHVFTHDSERQIPMLAVPGLTGYPEQYARFVYCLGCGEKLPRMFDALEESWCSYTRDIVIAAQPEHVICIGKGVARVVEPDLKKHFPSAYTVLDQPNAFLSSAEHFENYQTYSRICLGQKCPESAG